MPAPAPRSGPRLARERGFSHLEVLFGGVILAVAMLGHVAGTISGHRLARDEQSRRSAHQVIGQFMERIRSDDDWEGLYARLRTLQVLAGTSPLPGERLEDGRRAWPPAAYYPDFVVPPWMSNLHLLVDVPAGPAGTSGLREDATAPSFGLPADLNGDGVVDGAPRSADYQALPIIVTFRWTPAGEAARQIRISTWLRGYR